MTVLAEPLTVSIVSPFFNEGDGVSLFCRAINNLIHEIPEYQFEIICVDDGSSDNTLSQLIEIAQTNPNFKVIELSRNFGKESALTAGLHFAQGDAVIPFDADLQDPPEVIKILLSEWQMGADIVLAKRINRQVDSWLKRKTANWFYQLHNKMSPIKIHEDVGDFRLMNRAVLEAIKGLPEQQRFMKGLFAWVGFKTVTIEYSRASRASGETKFSGWKLWNLALEGITSFSTLPLRVWTYLGLTLGIASFFYGSFIILRTLIKGVDVPGYASILVSILFLGSLQLISIGVLGEYIGRIYSESKRRPLYFVRNIYPQKLDEGKSSH